MWKVEVELLVAGKGFDWIEQTFYGCSYIEVYTKLTTYLDALKEVNVLEMHVNFSRRID